ncbi:rRNA pseudouridine synthase [Zestomonas carbonaria]|uniref:Dual-specificity RNA pseudouridine synthase RluF n=1 Tax=Zestomonas carbonaria TaxID=2762745 RepID=A0A7U7ENJ8_9GAMM|nr:rRNA pseudouridine synthase [Pseudomonas carbonaria]CAD5108333.1 Ribosomal small subunit pseudouridine synthase A [Pseudomonas carbonaria]
MSEPTRLSKRIVELTGCSRREAELYIQGGWVTVDGAVVEEPQFKVLDQHIALLPGAAPTPLEPVTLLLNLPVGFADNAISLIDATNRWAEDRSGIRPLKGHLSHLSGALPLQRQAGGLLVFTQDWRTRRKLTEDGARLEQEYVVEVAGTIVANGLERLRRGLRLKGKELPPAKVSWQNETHLRFPLKNPEPVQIVAMCEAIGLRVLSMKRIRIGGVPMGKLPVGQWRYLGANERF